LNDVTAPLASIAGICRWILEQDPTTSMDINAATLHSNAAVLVATSQGLSPRARFGAMLGQQLHFHGISQFVAFKAQLQLVGMMEHVVTSTSVATLPSAGLSVEATKARAPAIKLEFPPTASTAPKRASKRNGKFAGSSDDSEFPCEGGQYAATVCFHALSDDVIDAFKHEIGSGPTADFFEMDAHIRPYDGMLLCHADSCAGLFVCFEHSVDAAVSIYTNLNYAHIPDYRYDHLIIFALFASPQ
jgi:hypothetical protein